METLKSLHHQITFVLNIAPHYREPIFRLLEQNMNCRWIFGENKTDILSCQTSFMQDVCFLPLVKGKINTWWLKGLSKVIREDNPHTIIFTGEIKFLSSWRMLICNRFRPKSRRLRILLWSHGWDGTERGLRRLVYKIYFGLADGLLLYGSRSKQIAIREGINPFKITIIHNSLNHDRFLQLRKTSATIKPYILKNWFKDPSLPVIVYIGRLSFIKKLEQLIQAVALLKENGKYFNTVIIGDGQDKTQIQNLVKELTLTENVYFCGAIYDIAESAPILYHADMCVSPGHIGLTAIHSLELGTPVVTHSDFSSHAPEVEVITPGKTGHLFEKDNIDSLADAIVSQHDFNNKVGRDTVRKYCYEAVESWTPEWQLKAFNKALD